MTKKTFILRSLLVVSSMIFLTAMKWNLLLKEKYAMIGIVGGILLAIYSSVAMYLYFEKMGIFYKLDELKYLFDSKEKLQKHRRNMILKCVSLLTVIPAYLLYVGVVKYILLYLLVVVVLVYVELVEYRKIKESFSL
ncbi:MAG: hypothetical protein Q3988_06620 [Gemella sp.]|nr:hypothetical protein [Gemella sp.]